MILKNEAPRRMGAAQGATITGCPGNLVVKHGPNRIGVVVVSFSFMVAVVYGALASIVVVLILVAQFSWFT